MTRWIAVALLGAAAAFALPQARAQGDVDYSFSELVPGSAQPAPKFLFLFGQPARWPATIAWRYNPANAPPAFAADTPGTVAKISAALDKWSAVCAVSYSYQGTTAVVPNTVTSGNPDFQNVVGWGTLGANIAGTTWTWYQTQGGSNVLIDGDIILSPTAVTSNGQLDRTATHEWGHFVGLAHSDINNTVMSGPPYSTYNGLTGLTDDDVRGCRCLYGPQSGGSAGYLCSLPRELAFGTVPAGTTSSPQPLTLTNSGNASMTVGAITASTGFGGSGCTQGTVLAPGQSCALQLTFSPSGQGAVTGQLAVAIQGEASPYRVSLTGTGGAAASPSPALSATTVAFGNQLVGTSSATKSVTLSNSGGGTLTLTSLPAIAGTNPGDFNRTGGTCANGTVLGAAQGCTLVFQFTPLATGARSASLALSTDAGTPPAIALTGTGTTPAPAPALALSSGALGFANQPVGTTSASQTVTVSNTGGGTLTLSALTPGGAQASEFPRTGTCSTSSALGAAQSCTLVFRFAPLAAGSRSASFGVTSNGGSGSIALSGTGDPPATAPAASVSGSSLGFGTVAVGVTSGVQSVTLTNTGTATLTLGTITLGGANPADFLRSGSCTAGGALAPSQSCTVDARFRPTVAGARAAAVSVAHNAAGSPAVITLSGIGGAAAVLPVAVVEYYHAAYDHYFITASASDIAALDSGQFGGWARTGYTFKAYLVQQPLTFGVCRFYLPPGYGDSHFYSANPAECDDVQRNFPQFVLESRSVMFLGVPDFVTGACPAGMVPVYRVWNGRSDTNHRYTIVRAVRDSMVAKGYVAEGSGADVVALCAPV